MIGKIASYILGAFGGFIVGDIAIRVIANPALFENMVLSISTLLGVIVSISIYTYRNEVHLRQNEITKDETVSLITHELKTALTSTGWAIQTVLDSDGDKITLENKKMLEQVGSSIHMTVLHAINLLDISRSKIGKFTISLEWVSLTQVGEIFKEIASKYSLGAKQKNLTLISNITLDNDLQVEVDIMRIRIILENLLENAIQYTELGTRKEIRMDIINNETTLSIKISDTGIGIPDSDKSKIFTEFYRASNARKALSSGSGIGLYTCYTYVKAHKGEISFESKEGEGTTFTIVLPLKTTADVKKFLENI